MIRRLRITPYHELSRKQKKRIYIRVKNRIRKYQDSELFYSPLDLDFNPVSSWCDFFFLGKKDHRRIWNSFITTAQKQFWDTASSIAFDNAYKRLTPESHKLREEFQKNRFIRFEQDGKTFYRLREDVQIFPELDNLTFYNFHKKEIKRIIECEPPVIHESIKLDFSFQYGVGVNFIVDKQTIDKDDINEAIEHFYSIGEKDWFNPEPAKNIQLVTEENYVPPEGNSRIHLMKTPNIHCL